MNIALVTFSISAIAGGNCNKNYWYDNVQHGATYQTGKNLYVKVKAQNHYDIQDMTLYINCLLYTSPSPRDKRQSRMPSSA